MDFHTLSHYFDTASLVSEPEAVDCTLSGGTKTTCIKLTVKPIPTNHSPGPWCPGSIQDGVNKGGIWLENGEVHDVDGAFIANMATFYSDSRWQLFEKDSGSVFVTDTYEQCAGAAKPNVEQQNQQHCVECKMQYLDDTAAVTYTIPIEPSIAKQPSPTRSAGSGVAFNGVRLDAPAPVADILGNYTLAPFDDCGGHINLAVGYHYHAATDCLNQTAAHTEHASAIGLAMDGFLILARTLNNGDISTDLDQCGGHETAGLGYHYHAGAQGSNAILSCLKAEYGCVSSTPDAVCDATTSRHPGGGARPDFSAAAERLSVSEKNLKQALGGPPPNLEDAANKLGITVKELQQALRGP